MSVVAAPEAGDAVRADKQWPRHFATASVALLIGILVWAPFPLGSNREWSWSLLALLVAVCWLLWSVWAVQTWSAQLAHLKRLFVPSLLALAALSWVGVQILPIVPHAWVHPQWEVAIHVLGRPTTEIISLNPWRTQSEASKLLIYLCVFCLAFSLTRNPTRASYCLNAIIFIGAGYAVYGFILGLLGTSQYALYYPEPKLVTLPAGPFVLHNSFATYEGLAALVSILKLVDIVQQKAVTTKGPRYFLTSILKISLGSGAYALVAAILTFSALIISASRAGVFATLCGLLVTGLLAFFISFPKRRTRWALLGLALPMALLGMLILLNGSTLESRTQELIDAGSSDAIRSALRLSAERMIGSAPLLGLGLGTFEDAYPFYAQQMFPYVMDAAHCDYLEFAAGVGLPAAICWWVAMAWIFISTVTGVFRRHRGKIYPLVGVGATVLVGAHSFVDFSLQIPAIAVTYACLLGLGAAQAYSTR